MRFECELGTGPVNGVVVSDAEPNATGPMNWRRNYGEFVSKHRAATLFAITASQLESSD